MKIEVDHSYLINTAREIESYVDSLTIYMKDATNEVYKLTKNDWKDIEGKKFCKNFLAQNDDDSVTERVKAELRTFAKALRNAERLYRDAQSNAYFKEFLSEVLPL